MSKSYDDPAAKQPEQDGVRPSLIGRMPGEITAVVGRDDRVEAEIRSQLAQRLLAGGPTAEISHALLALIVAVLAWPTVSLPVLIVWVTAVFAVTLVRFAVRRRLRRMDTSANKVFAAMRGSATAQGVAWGVLVLLLARQLPFQDLAVIMVVFAGLVGGAIVTFSADPVSFHLLLGTLIGPLTIALVLNGQERSHLVSLALVVLFVLAITSLYQRSYNGLMEHLRLLKHFEISQEKTSRERSYLDALLTSAPNAIVTLDKQGRILGVNPAFESMFGYEAHEVINREIGAVFQLDHRGESSRAVEVRAGDGGVVVEEVVRKRNRAGQGSSGRSELCHVRRCHRNEAGSDCRASCGGAVQGAGRVRGGLGLASGSGGPVDIRQSRVRADLRDGT